MSYDYLLWRTDRVVEAREIDESTVETWTDVDALRTNLSTLWPSLVWESDGRGANDCSGASPVAAVRLPTEGKPHDPLVVRHCGNRTKICGDGFLANADYRR